MSQLEYKINCYGLVVDADGCFACKHGDHLPNVTCQA